MIFFISVLIIKCKSYGQNEELKKKMKWKKQTHRPIYYIQVHKAHTHTHGETYVFITYFDIHTVYVYEVKRRKMRIYCEYTYLHDLILRRWKIALSLLFS